MLAFLFNDNLLFIYFNTMRVFELTSYTTFSHVGPVNCVRVETVRGSYVAKQTTDNEY